MRKQQRVGLPHLAGATKDALYRLDHVGVGVSRREGGELRPLDLVRGRLGVIAGLHEIQLRPLDLVRGRLGVVAR